MIPVGYMLKKVALRPDWLGAESVVDIYSVQSCATADFADYINFWKHNGWWFFDAPEVIDELTKTHGIDVSGMTLFYYEVYEEEFDEHSEQWSAFSPEPSFTTDVVVPKEKHLEGYDVTPFAAHTSPECSPLSCCSLATEISVNEHCLFRSFDEAKAALQNGKFRDSEPGPFRIMAVYTVKGVTEGFSRD